MEPAKVAFQTVLFIIRISLLKPEVGTATLDGVLPRKLLSNWASAYRSLFGATRPATHDMKARALTAPSIASHYCSHPTRNPP